MAGLLEAEHDLSEPRLRARLRRSLREEALAGLRLATRARLAAAAVIALLIPFISTMPWSLLYEAGVVVIAGSGLLHHRLARTMPEAYPLSALFIAFDFAAVALVMFLPAVLPADQVGPTWPPQMILRDGGFLYFFLLLVLAALSHGPLLVLWAGVSGTLVWSGVIAWIALRPETLVGDGPAESPEQVMARQLDPAYLDLDLAIQDVTLFLIVAAILASAVWRAHRLVERQVEAARERANLARYFWPDVVDQLGRNDTSLFQAGTLPVAVLFADIVGFTPWAERAGPESTVAFLRAFHGRLERLVFEHGGTLDKFLGDGLMATFGTPASGSRDAADALACGLAMVDEIADWSRRREAEGEPSVRLSVGLHFGPVVLGNIGTRRRLEFAVLGDVVNVASRLEAATRNLACSLVASDDLVAAARACEPALWDALAPRLAPATPQALRGRSEPIAVWTDLA